MVFVVVRYEKAIDPVYTTAGKKRSWPPIGRRIVTAVNQNTAAIACGHEGACTVLHIKNFKYHVTSPSGQKFRYYFGRRPA
jgi:hypothetical protein